MSSVPVAITAGLPVPADPAALLLEAAEAAKCAACGCAHEASAALAALPADAPLRLHDAARRLASSLTGQRYPCLGCAVCWPAEALSLVQEAGLVADGASCPAEPVLPRPGWPPLAGDYTVLRYSAPVAVCTIGDSDLAASVAARAGAEVAIVGTLTTENLGIERLVRNTITNPRLRFVIVCGQEVEQRIGHHPGGSLLALAANGTDGRGRIVDAPGRRPRLRNLSPGEIAHFRAHVEIVGLIGTVDTAAILAASQQSAAPSPTPPATWSCTPTPPGNCWSSSTTAMTACSPPWSKPAARPTGTPAYWPQAWSAAWTTPPTSAANSPAPSMRSATAPATGRMQHPDKSPVSVAARTRRDTRESVSRKAGHAGS